MRCSQDYTLQVKPVTEIWTKIEHENHSYPPSLSLHGKIRFSTKSDIVECLEKFCTTRGEAPSVDVIILDGAALINMLKPIGVKTFQEYARHVFLSCIKAQL